MLRVTTGRLLHCPPPWLVAPSELGRSHMSTYKQCKFMTLRSWLCDTYGLSSVDLLAYSPSYSMICARLLQQYHMSYLGFCLHRVTSRELHVRGHALGVQHEKTLHEKSLHNVVMLTTSFAYNKPRNLVLSDPSCFQFICHSLICQDMLDVLAVKLWHSSPDHVFNEANGLGSSGPQRTG